MMLLVDSMDKHLMLVSTEEKFSCHSAYDTIEDLLPDHMLLANSSDYSSSDAFFLYLCRADFLPAHGNTFNHWVPCWHKDQIGHEQFHLAWCIFEAEQAERRHFLQSSMNDLMKSEDADADCKMDSLLAELDTVDAQQIAYAELKSNGLFPEDVPKDGNCGLWSLLKLRQGKPRCLMEGEPDPCKMDAMFALRKET